MFPARVVSNITGRFAFSKLKSDVSPPRFLATARSNTQHIYGSGVVGRRRCFTPQRYSYIEGKLCSFSTVCGRQATETSPSSERGKFPLLKSCSVDAVRNIVSVGWGNGVTSNFHGLWLRDFCPSLVHPSTGQKLGSVADLPITSGTVMDAKITEDGRRLSVSWVSKEGNAEIGLKESEVSFFESDWLRKHRCVERISSLQRKDGTPRPYNPDGKLTPTISFDSIVDVSQERKGEEMEKGALDFCTKLAEKGLCIVKNAPPKDDVCLQIGNVIAPVWESIYGLTFYVKAEKNPINIAYTPLPIDLHVDLQYYESPPGIQLLHCLEFDPEVIGGESLFLDSFYIAELLRERDPASFRTLSTVPTNFRKDHMDRDRPVQMSYNRPIIEVNHRTEVIGVNWSPPFEGPVKLPADQVEDYYNAYSSFRSLLREAESEGLVTEFRLSKGDCVVFNQRRLLHGRREFSSHGNRNLQGCYINIDDFRSRYLELRRRFASDEVDIVDGAYDDNLMVGNKCW